MDGRHVARSVQLEKQSIPLLQHESEPKGCMGSLRSSWSAIFLELRGPQRLWTTLLAALLTSISPLLGGYTLGFASPALLELNDAKVPDKYHLKGLSLAMFAVRDAAESTLIMHVITTHCIGISTCGCCSWRTGCWICCESCRKKICPDGVCCLESDWLVVADERQLLE